MVYNKRYLLIKIIEIQEIVLREKAKGKSQAWIYKNLIRDVYCISQGTFNNYLSRNARLELKEMEERITE